MATSRSNPKTYRAIWRWHFYAGLIVAPFLLILSLTGAIYLFNDEINDATMPHLRFVETVTDPMPVSHLMRSALHDYPGTVTRVDMPSAANRSAIVFVRTDDNQDQRVAVNPQTAEVLGAYIYAQTLVGFADRMHGSLTLGTIGDRIVELAACWALVLIITGLYLWWPRGLKGPGGIVYPRLWLKGRLFWRDIHAVTGIWSAAVIIFLILTGLPWAGVQGNVVKQVAASVGVGYPASNRNYNAPKSDPTMKGALGEAPWTLEDTPLPKSDPHAGHPGHHIAPAQKDEAAIAGVDAITAQLMVHGLTQPYRLFMPSGPEGVYTVYTYPDQPEGQRTLYFDRYSSALIREIAYADYGWAAKAIELGVQLHMGNYFGLANQVLMLLACVTIVMLVISGFIMWWRRRPEGEAGFPARIPDTRLRVATGLLIIGGMLLPLMGASLIIVWVIDRIWLWRKQS
ncbi:MAG: PepSY domain-containing protein [Asticcacaulis sp.]